MHKVLIAINNMKIGGAQKSLLSFLQEFSVSEFAKEYAVDLLVMDPEGAYMAQIPETIRLISPPAELRWLGARITYKMVREHFSWRALCGEIGWIAGKRLKLHNAKLNTEQQLWQSWHRFISKLEKTYDYAISYMDGPTNYWLMDKVRSGKKILWMHSEYQKQKYDPEFDRPYLEACDAIVTISEKCRRCLAQEFPESEKKIHVLENITSPEMVIRKGNEGKISEFDGGSGMKILSVGRLNRQKGFDMAVEAAGRLRDAGEDFLWLVVGEGPEHEQLQKQIDSRGISDCFRLLGARENPYPYMKACDILVQPSRVEGKSIVLDEAKIFCKPIVATNYTTVKDSIEHGKSGWITDMTPEALSDGIRRMMQDPELRRTLVEYGEKQPKGNVQELKRYVDVMLK